MPQRFGNLDEVKEACFVLDRLPRDQILFGQNVRGKTRSDQCLRDRLPALNPIPIAPQQVEQSQ